MNAFFHATLMIDPLPNTHGQITGFTLALQTISLLKPLDLTDITSLLQYNGQSKSFSPIRRSHLLQAAHSLFIMHNDRMLNLKPKVGPSSYSSHQSCPVAANMDRRRGLETDSTLGRGDEGPTCSRSGCRHTCAGRRRTSGGWTRSDRLQRKTFTGQKTRLRSARLPS
jgi:hypothetical protein